MHSDATTGNQVIEPSALPAAAEIDYRPVSPRYQRVILVHAALFAVLAVILSGALRLAADGGLPVFLHPLFVALAVVVAMAGVAVWARAWVRCMGYALRERDIFHRRGVFWRLYTAVPFSRVQHVETHHGPLDRYFGLATIKVYTAGATSADLQIPGLPAADAERLHAFLLAQAGETDGGG